MPEDGAVFPSQASATGALPADPAGLPRVLVSEEDALGFGTAGSLGSLSEAPHLHFSNFSRFAHLYFRRF